MPGSVFFRLAKHTLLVLFSAQNHIAQRHCHRRFNVNVADTHCTCLCLIGCATSTSWKACENTTIW